MVYGSGGSVNKGLKNLVISNARGGTTKEIIDSNGYGVLVNVR